MFEAIKTVVTENWMNRKRMVRLANYELKAQNNGTVFGFLWNFFNPALQIAVYWFVFAIGLKPNKDILEKEKLEYNERGLISINDKCETNIEKVYAGGDLSEAKSTVCRALGSSRKAAQAIMERLGKNV